MPSVKDARPELAYVVVTYRSAEQIATCLDAIDADRGGSDWPIVVVDNASPDASATLAADHRSHPIVLRAPTNAGFGSGCNAGASAIDASAFFFVNPDANLPAQAGERLLAELRAAADLGVVGASVVSMGEAEAAGADPSARSAIGHFLLASRTGPLRGIFPALQLHLGADARSRDVDWTGAAAMLVRSDAFKQVGGFDERLFLYMEDVDLCRRLRAKGWRIRLVPTVRVQHMLGASQGSEQAARWYQAFDAYVRHTHGPAQARVAAAAAASGLAARALVSRFAGSSENGKTERFRRGAAAALRCLLHGDAA
jgi:N-acetylglucosaminyl-diphospho-decaprenol L-rhamnosyltransferase